MEKKEKKIQRKQKDGNNNKFIRGSEERKRKDVVVALTSSRIMKSSVVTGQAPVSLEWKNSPRTRGNTPAHQKLYTAYIYIYIIAEAIHAAAKKVLIEKMMISEVSPSICDIIIVVVDASKVRT